jgi:predicted O-methyltransferase YrrM
MKATTSAIRLLPTLPVLELMRPIEGWLEDEEADLLLAAAAASLRSQPTHPIVEIGSYCGRSTVVLASAVAAMAPANRVYAIDPHEGTVGALDRRITTGEGTLERFQRNIANAGVSDVVATIQRYSTNVEWDGPIGMLFIDGLHDFSSVSHDFEHFARFLEPGSLIAFHDYAGYYPGVVACVDQLLLSGEYRRVAQARSMVVIERRGGQ